MPKKGQAPTANAWPPAIGDEKVKAATGRNWMGWLVILNRANANAMPHKEIAKLYERPAGAKPATPKGYRRGNMMLTNPIINVEGDVATAHLIWTGFMNEGVGKPPTLTEQGREYTELKKVNGKWMISRRFISSDSGLPDKFDATWKPREHR